MADILKVFSGNEKGEFVRGVTQFRDTISPSHEKYKPEKNRYHLYISYACPWACRTLAVRTLKGLEDVISYDVVQTLLPPAAGWTFGDEPGATPPEKVVDGYKTLREAYVQADPNFNGRVTVPVLYDKHTKTIVNNESIEICKIFNSAFNSLAKNPNLDLYPNDLKEEMDTLYDFVYHNVNNGVYKCGFASKQGAYDEAFDNLFAALDKLEERLSKQRYLHGDKLTLNDICLFTTLVRFDPVYITHFKCNKKRLVDYANLFGFTKDVYQTEKIRDTVNIDHIKKHYFTSHTGINPYGIVAKGPELSFEGPHGRDQLAHK